MTTPIPPDDQLDPQELARGLRALVETLPKMVHEQVGAVRAETDAVLDLTRELEKSVTTENEALRLAATATLSLSGRLLDMITRLQDRDTRQRLMVSLQGTLIELLSTVTFGGGFADQQEAADHAKRLMVAIDDVYAWPDDKWDDDATWDAFYARLWPHSAPPA